MALSMVDSCSVFVADLRLQHARLERIGACDHDLLADHQPRLDNSTSGELVAELNGALLVPALGEQEDGRLPLHEDDGSIWHADGRRRRCVAARIDDRFGEHLRLESAVPVGHLDSCGNGAGLLVQQTRHVGDLPLKGLVWIGRHHHTRRDAGPHLAQLVFGEIGFHPDGRQVSNGEKRVTGRSQFANGGLLLHHGASQRRRQRERGFDAAQPLGIHAQQLQPVLGGTQGDSGALALGLEPEEVLLRNDLLSVQRGCALEVRLSRTIGGLRLKQGHRSFTDGKAVQCGQWLPRLHLVSQIGRHPDDASFDPRRDARDTVLVHADGGRDADDVRYRLVLHGLVLDAGTLCLVGR
mmetsp:Transcript_12841/g.29951  ORF Transcript_12841/g.29951 Transcript_12841/m.29951 type:complete len:353 (+) Transcript_12841:1416-2474(+)